MASRVLGVFSWAGVVMGAGLAIAQTQITSPLTPRSNPPVAQASAPNVWRPAETDPASAKGPPKSDATKPDAADAGSTAAPSLPITPHQPIAKVTNGSGTLPNDKGQVWREYDISPYTSRVTSNKPEQAIVDWILRETGYESWHSDPVGLLSADRQTLRVYHTPAMQTTVADIVDRFVNPDTEQQGFGVRIISVGSPTWRARLQRSLHPVVTQTQGVQAWLISKEDAALTLADFRKRGDAREHSSPQLLIFNGQTSTVAGTRPRNYVRNINLRSDGWPAFEPEMAQIQEGFTLELSPLMSIDGRTCDAIVKCNIDQVEKLVPVPLDVSTTVAPRQRTQIDVPQTASFRLHERFRWPVDQVLLVSLGVVATPTPGDTSGAWILPTSGPGRAEVLLLIDNKGNVARTTTPTTVPTGPVPATAASPANHVRY